MLTLHMLMLLKQVNSTSPDPSTVRFENVLSANCPPVVNAPNTREKQKNKTKCDEFDAHYLNISHDSWYSHHQTSQPLLRLEHVFGAKCL